MNWIFNRNKNTYSATPTYILGGSVLFILFIGSVGYMLRPIANIIEELHSESESDSD